jgi:hypothetical protein
MRNKKIVSGIIFILAGQLIALLIWLIFKENSFTHLAVASVAGFLISYKGKNNVA